jgi:DeoR/GlpR family transcriptional regulator of sugar metabolism
MLKEERQNFILETLRKNGKVMAGELSRQFEVSEDTIRRDLRELANQGRMLRVHGGGLPHSPAGISYTERLKQSPAVKTALAREATRFIRNGQTIFLDSGTTTQQIAQLFPADIRATVITNSPITAIELSQHDLLDIIMVGGKINKEMRIITSSTALDAIRSIHADLCFLGICSLDPIGGISVVDYDEAAIKKAMIDGSDQVVALAASEKLGTISPFRVGPITDLDCLVTQKDLADEILSPYMELGIEVIRG